jgi:hypothetical protein
MPEVRASGRIQAAVAAVAARQHGVVTAAQLRACGMSTSAIGDWVNARRLHRLFPGVYAVGHRGLSFEGRWMAAVLALGEEAFLSHRSAAMLWRMLEPVAGPVHVTLRGDNGRKPRRVWSSTDPPPSVPVRSRVAMASR